MCVFVCGCVLQGCLPLVLMFDIKEELEVDPQVVSSLMEQLDVFISIKPKPKQPNKVRTHKQESGLGFLYKYI